MPLMPFFEQPVLHLGPLSIHAFGALVALGIFVGMQLTLWKAKREGLDPKFDEDLIWYAVLIGFVSAHVFDTVAYYPERIAENPLVLLKIWDGISSFGGILGGLGGMAYFFWRKGKHLPVGAKMRYVDTIAYGWPFAWVFGRMGCTVAFDHPGTITTFPLATSLKSEAAQDYIRGVYVNADAVAQLPQRFDGLGFHNLGFYEMLYTLVVIVPVVAFFGRKQRAPGFFLALFLVLYAPIRFLMDYLRMADVRYFGFTPGQYAAALVFAAGVFLFTRLPALAASEAAGAGRAKARV